jgi:hypothetical protein
MENQALKIEVLLHEYDTLRQEVMSRYSAQFQTIGAIGVIFAALIAAMVTGLGVVPGLWLIACGFVAFWALFLWADADISRLAKRLIELEKDVNTRAGETLLVWESSRSWGGGLMQIISRALRRKAK